MFSGRPQNKPSKNAAQKNIGVEIAHILEELITAVVLALLFIEFVMGAYHIPTGSMADTLKGAHFRLCCPQCGYKYDYGFIPQIHQRLKAAPARCPNCGYYQSTAVTTPIATGDRIMVLKCIYQFFEPKRWDVVVFKNPLAPSINYIKRLIARPGETVEIIDGDIYIDGQISRKPPKVQKELWMPIYDNDYQPVRPMEPFFNEHPWQQPFKNVANSKWKLDKDNPTQFYLDSPPDQINSLTYDTSIGNDFRATYAYNCISGYNRRPYCSDLMMRFYLRSSNSRGRVGISLSKYQTHYKAWADFTGEMVIAKVSRGKETILNHKSIKPPAANKHTLVKFANVDHQLIFQFGSENLTYDLGRSPKDAGPRKTDIQPQVKIFGSGKLALSHIAIFRDIHYTTANGPVSSRASEGNPFKLGKDEFFVLGDNSPNSQDSRWWSEPGRANNNLFYRRGIVPREYLIGKALFVYWPSGFKPFPKFPFAIIPNVGQVRLIYSGSSKNP